MPFREFQKVFMKQGQFLVKANVKIGIPNKWRLFVKRLESVWTKENLL